MGRGSDANRRRRHQVKPRSSRPVESSSGSGHDAARCVRQDVPDFVSVLRRRGGNSLQGRGSDRNAVIAKVFWRGLVPNSRPWGIFQQEQRASEILNHRNIARVFDRGLRAGYPFTIIEFLGGGTLRDWLRTHDRLPGRDIASIASQVADAVDYAHSRGINS